MYRTSSYFLIAEASLLLCMGVNGCSRQEDTGDIVDAPSRTVLAAPVRVKLCGPPDEFPLIEATVNGCGPHLYVLDTGTSGLVLSRRLLPEIKARPLAATFTMRTLAGPRFLGSEYGVEVVRIGSAEFCNLTACSADLSNLEASIGQKLGGVLGIGVFADCLLTINYPAGEVLLEPSGTAPLSAGQNTSVLPLALSPLGTPHIVLDIRGSKVWSMIDSGLKTAFVVPQPLLQRLPATSPPIRIYVSRPTFHGSTPVHAARLDGSILLGNHEFVRPIVEVLPDRLLLGHEALKHFRVSLDLKKRQATFTRAGCGPIGPPPPIRHQGFFYTQMVDRLLVTESIREVTLEQLGLREGDEVIAVNGIRVSDLPPGGVRDLANAHDTLTLDIIRGNVKTSVTVPATVLIP